MRHFSMRRSKLVKLTVLPVLASACATVPVRDEDVERIDTGMRSEQFSAFTPGAEGMPLVIAEGVAPYVEEGVYDSRPYGYSPYDYGYGYGYGFGTGGARLGLVGHTGFGVSSVARGGFGGALGVGFGGGGFGG